VASTSSIILVILSTFISATGSLVFNISSKKLRFNFKHILKNHNLFLGFLLFGFSALIYITALKGGDLNVLYPITSLTYVWSTLLAKKFLKERINLYKWLGILLIILGSIFIVQ
jgi:uncharacterized membrane protein